jgi:hypothetical protein
VILCCIFFFIYSVVRETRYSATILACMHAALFCATVLGCLLVKELACNSAAIL